MLKRILNIRILLVVCLALLLGWGVWHQFAGTRATHAASTTSHWLYVVDDGTVFVYDIDNNNALVKQITIPEAGKRGVGVSPQLGMLYVSFCGATNCGGGHGSLLAYDLVHNAVAWSVNYAFGVDQFAVTADGMKIYMPHGSDAIDNTTSIIDATNGNVIGSINTGTNGHNTITSLDGSQVYLAGYTGNNFNYVDVVNPANNQVILKAGPVINGVRPFTVNGQHTLMFTTSTNTCGFQVLSLTSGAVLYTVPFSGSCVWGASNAPSHGIALSPDEKRVYVVDAPLDQLEVYDVSGLPASAPKFVSSIPMTSFNGTESPCQTYCEREGWVLSDLSGRYVYVGDTGDVISTSSLTVVGTLPALQNTRQMVEIDWTNGAISATSTRFGLGRVTGTASAPPSTPPGPVNKTWYFAEGRVGKGFREYLTVENPSANACAATIQYNYTPDGGTPATKSVGITVNPDSRLTESVNNDLGYPDSGPGAILATLVTVNGSATPSCNGVVVERPIYFTNFAGIASGTDVLGVTHLNTSFYFADVASGANAASFLTILNPNGSSANVTATYYANGNVVGTQTATVPANARGTISPNAISLPTHVAAVVTSSQPILVERPTYFKGAAVNGTTVSGAYDIVGASALASDWLFAEGYTGGSTQEYLTIANVDPAKTSATVTITLKSKTGATQSYTIVVPAQSQTIWNVNVNNVFTGSSPEVSVEVKSAGANIVVQREMYFTYNHTLTNGNVTTCVGGTDVIGQVGPAAYSSYTFAEGYANTGYNDWLTIQNPTGNAETISVTLVNGLGQSYVQNVSVPANARFTEDLASLVQTVFSAGTNSSANSFSMTVQTSNGAVFVAERPIYFNTNGVSSFGTQGGGDIIGYIGN